MRVVTAIEDIELNDDDIVCFLAGGITNCADWQSAVIDELSKYDTEHLVIMNPRRKNFPIENPNASREQIEWEFKWLNHCDIFSMYFDGGESLQPICLYELGRHLPLKRDIVVSVEKGYKREQDVIIQSELALKEDIVIRNANPQKHAKAILDKYKWLCWESGYIH